jgi:hypothetical protein
MGAIMMPKPALRTLAIAAVAAVAGVAAGIGVGALVFDEDEGTQSQVLPVRAQLDAANQRVADLEKRVAELEGELKPTGAPATVGPSRVSIELAPEDRDWDPCAEPGLCEFAQTVDNAIARRDVNAVMALIAWQQATCGESPRPLDPSECVDWPLEEAIPAVLVGLYQSEGGLVSRWNVHRLVENGTWEGGPIFSRDIERRVRATIQPADYRSDQQSTFELMTGVEFARLPSLPERAQDRRYLVFSVFDDGGRWRIASILDAGPGYLTDTFSVSRFRYYPLSGS